MRAWPEIGAGVALLALSGFVLAVSSTYPMGSATAMGPGYIPRLLGVCLALLSLGIIVTGRRTSRRLTPVRWRPFAAVCGSLLVFALLVRPLGLLPTTFALGVVASLAEPPFKPLHTLAIGAGISVLAYLIFIVMLELPIRPFWF